MKTRLFVLVTLFMMLFSASAFVYLSEEAADRWLAKGGSF